MAKSSGSGLDLVVTHLNVPYGPLVTRADLSNALTNGSRTSIPSSAANVLAYMFVEVDPQLNIRCVNEVGSGVAKANALYEETLRDHIPRVLAWENAVRHLL